MEGTVARLVQDKGFGFIECERKDYFFHRSALPRGTFETLYVGQKVTFEAEKGPKGPRAVNVNLY